MDICNSRVTFATETRPKGLLDPKLGDDRSLSISRDSLDLVTEGTSIDV